MHRILHLYEQNLGGGKGDNFAHSQTLQSIDAQLCLSALAPQENVQQTAQAVQRNRALQSLHRKQPRPYVTEEYISQENKEEDPSQYIQLGQVRE